MRIKLKLQEKYISAIIILLAIGGGVLIFYFRGWRGWGEPAVSPTPSSNVVINQVTTDKLPEEFPKDVPLEAGVQLTMNYNATNADGKFQASREFISKKTVAQNFTLYQKALKDNGWEITNVQENTAAGSLIFAKKGNYNLNIRIYAGPDNKVRVSISNIVE